MTNWLSEYAGEDQRQIDQENAKGLQLNPTTPKEVGLFAGAGKAPFTGAAAGFAKVADTLATPFDAVADRVGYTLKDMNSQEPIESYDEYRSKKEKARNDLILEGIDALQDRQNTGLVGHIGFGLGDYVTRGTMGSLAGGIGGAVAFTGLSETDYNYKDLVRQGVDEKTALKVSAVDGVVAGASTALPLSFGFVGKGGIVKDGVLAIGGATALGTGGQALSGQILESAGYEKQSKKYEVTKETLGINLALNAALFGGSRYARGRLDPEVATELNNADVDRIQNASNQVDDLLVSNEIDFEQTLTPVNAADDFIQNNNHNRNLDTATQQVLSGQPVNVPKPVNGAPKPRQSTKVTASQASSYTAKPWAKKIAYEAERRGINPVDALVISHIETGGTFDPNIQPKGRDGRLLSSATGLYQTITDTFNNMGGGDRFNGDHQIRAGLNYYQHNSKIFKQKFGRDPSGLEVYFMHFFGEGGGPVFLKANNNAMFSTVATSWSKPYKNKKTGKQVSAAEQGAKIAKSHGFQNMTVAQVKAKYQKRWDQVAKQYGGDGSTVSTAHGMDGTSYDVSYEVRSLDDLIASNDANFAVNPHYPAELQPRDRTREASRQQIERMADDLKPELLGESYKLSDGAPIIGQDGVVESGNGRTLALRRAYENGKADEYRAYIEQYAGEKGWDISGINNPVLVRTRLTDTDRVQFSRLANESDVAQFSASERASSDIDRLPDASLLRTNADGSINLDGSMDFVRGFVDQLPTSERAQAITGDGRLSQEGKRRIESALVQRAYGDSTLVTRLAENLDDDSKTVLNALLRSAPQLAQLGDLVRQGGRHSNTIAQDLATAAQRLSDIKASGQRVDDYLNQGQLIDDGLSPGARDFLNVFDQNNRSAKAISDNIQSKINEIEAKGDPRQGSLFGESPEEMAALDIILNNPDQQISVSRTRPDGEVEEITMTLRERLDELEAEAKQAESDVTATQAAISCALQFGE